MLASKFLGLPANAPAAATMADLGWESMEARYTQLRLMLLGRIILMPRNRLVKRVFLWAEKDAIRRSSRVHNWVYYSYLWVKRLNLNARLHKLELLAAKGQNSPHEKVYERKLLNEWRRAVIGALRRRDDAKFQKALSQDGTKLRTYKLFKLSIGLEPYTRLPPADRRLIAQLRCGMAPLAIETGRWQGLAVEERLCRLCQDNLQLNVVENEVHFLVDCPAYNEARMELRAKLQHDGLDLDTMDTKTKLKLLLAFPSRLRYIMEFIRNARKIRREKLQALGKENELKSRELADRKKTEIINVNRML